MNTQQYINEGAAFLLDNPVKAAVHTSLHAGVVQAPIHLGIGGAPGLTVYQLTAQQERRDMVIEPYFMTGPLWPNLVLPVWRWRIGHHLLEKIGL